jgi:hypothetical protein
MDGQFSEAKGASGNKGAFECLVWESVFLQANICTCNGIEMRSVEDIACENGGIQASIVLIEIVAKGQSLVNADALTLVPEEPAPKAPDKLASVLISDGGCIGSVSAWGGALYHRLIHSPL